MSLKLVWNTDWDRGPKPRAKKRSARAIAKQIIKSYRRGDDLPEHEEHLIHDTAVEYGQMLDNCVHMKVFENLLTENIEALQGTGGEFDYI